MGLVASGQDPLLRGRPPLFFPLLRTASAVMLSVARTWLMMFSAFSRSFHIPFLASLRLKIVVS